jgi:hypothetical protein
MGVFEKSVDYGPIHTLFLIIFILLLIGLLMNFLTLKISEKFNYTNILSIVVFVLTIGYVYLLSSLDKYLGPVMIQHSFSVFLFLILSLVSVFEGVFEYLIDERKKYYN